jgi:aryl-alcohol dehydrogenase-like predicted oxidoreductase
MSRLGFGVSGPHASPAMTRGQTIRLIHEALELGVNTFDTAPLYGHGEAETRLGSALARRDRSKLVLMTKAGVPRRGVRDFTPAGIRTSLDGSLSRLGVDHVDILFLQGIAADELTPELQDCLHTLLDRGKVVEIGVSGRPPGLFKPLEADVFGAAMAPVHADMPDADLARLADEYVRNRLVVGIEAFAAAHRPMRLPRSPADAWYLARRLVRQTGSGGDLTPEAALKWALDRNFSTTLCLTTKSEHLRANAALAGL